MARRRRRRAAGQRLGAGAARRAGHAGSEPGKGAGFSGEGAVLHLVAGGDANEDAAFVSTLLAFEPRIDIAQLAARALLPDAQIASALGVLASSGRWGSIWRRARTSIARCRCRRGCWIRCIPGWPRRASWWPAAGCGAKARSSTVQSAQQRYRIALGAEPQTVAPALARQVSRHARAVQARWRCACFLIPSMRLEPEHDLEPDRTPRGCASRRRRRRGDIAPFARALDGADEDERAALARPCRHRACSARRGRRPLLVLAAALGKQARGGDAGAGGHGTQARIWRAPRR